MVACGDADATDGGFAVHYPAATPVVPYWMDSWREQRAHIDAGVEDGETCRVASKRLGIGSGGASQLPIYTQPWLGSGGGNPAPAARCGG